MDSVSTTFILDVLVQVDKSPEGQFIQLMALPRTLQQKITKLVDPPGKNRDVEEILLQVAQDPDCGAVVQQGLLLRTHTEQRRPMIDERTHGTCCTVPGLIFVHGFASKKLFYVYSAHLPIYMNAERFCSLLKVKSFY